MWYLTPSTAVYFVLVLYRKGTLGGRVGGVLPLVLHLLAASRLTTLHSIDLSQQIENLDRF
jgi:hypothetical protein